MSPTAPTYPRGQATPRAKITREAMISLLLVLLACVALTACGGSSNSSSSSTTSAAAAAPTTSTTTPSTPTTSSTTSAATPTKGAPATPAPVTAQQRASLIAFIGCMRRHGIHIPDPDANGNVNLHGINVKSHHYQTVGTACFNHPSK